VDGGLAAAFLEFLRQNGITAWQPPEKLDKKGGDKRSIVEIEIEAGTASRDLESLANEFLGDKPLK